MGFPRPAGDWADHGKDGRPWPKRFHGSADPGRVVHVHVREVGSPGWRFALLFRDWLRSEPAERDAYARVKTELAARMPRLDAYVEAKEPWFDAAYDRARAWAEATGWAPPPAP